MNDLSAFHVYAVYTFSPVDNDEDSKFSEDEFDDLNSDNHITQMRKKIRAESGKPIRMMPAGS